MFLLCLVVWIDNLLWFVICYLLLFLGINCCWFLLDSWLYGGTYLWCFDSPFGFVFVCWLLLFVDILVFLFGIVCVFVCFLWLIVGVFLCCGFYWLGLLIVILFCWFAFACCVCVCYIDQVCDLGLGWIVYLLCWFTLVGFNCYT